MLILGLETSCDETAAAVLKITGPTAQILNSVIASQAKLHEKTGGVVPEVAARAHIEKIIPTLKLALKKAKIEIADTDAIAVTTGPGLITSLRVGVDTAKTLGFALNIPIIAVNHIEAHIFSPFIADSRFQLSDFKSNFPAISLVVSGGHTGLFVVKNWLEYKKLGSTLDDAAGECFDKVAKLLGLPYPGGPALAELAKQGKPVINFPRPLIHSKDFNFSFSGLKTAVLYYLRDVSPPAHSSPSDALPSESRTRRGMARSAERLGAKLKANIAASVQAAIVDVLVAKTLSAAKQYKAKTILLGGGVAANSVLRKSLNLQSKIFNLNFLTAQKKFCTDNAAMIAFAGYLHARQGQFTPLSKVRADANWEL